MPSFVLHWAQGRVLLLGLVPLASGCSLADQKPSGNPPTVKAISAPTAPFLPVARSLVAAINSGDQEAMQKLFAPALRQVLPAEKAEPFFQGVRQMRGKILQVGPPQVDAGTAYLRLKGERGVWDLQLTLNAQNQISSLLIQAAGPNFVVPAHNADVLHLPFRGEWTVFWGGATQEQNYHIVSPAQRRAMDVVVTNSRGHSFRSAGKSNADYYAYGQEILASGAGTVVKVTDGVAENVPGEMNAEQVAGNCVAGNCVAGNCVAGNCVVVQQGPNEFAFFAHLQPGSIRVRVGERVKAGQVLGKCGNSGHSSEPHLHFHLQNTADLGDGSGIAPLFQGVQVARAGKSLLLPSYAPLRGDRIRAKVETK